MIINQLHSIGDILFTEPIFRHYWRKNNKKPIVPVRDHLLWLANYIESAEFVPESKARKVIDLESLEVRPDYLPLRWANQIYRGYDPNDHHDFENMMLDKYRLAGLDPMLWKTLDIKLEETEITKQIWGDCVYEVDDYGWTLINENSQAGKIKINIPDPKIEMFNRKGATVIDWWKAMAYAENHHVSTCTFFLFQAMKNKNLDNRMGKIVIYPRPNIDGLRGISQLNPDFKYEIGII